MSTAEKFMDLLRESVIVQGLLTVAVVGVWLFMIATVKPVPDTLTNIVGLVFGFFFGGKYALAMSKKNGGA